MSESSSESTSGADDPGQGITDDQLPDDLNPEKNPLAREPEDDEDGAVATGDSGSAGAGPDAGEPGPPA